MSDQVPKGLEQADRILFDIDTRWRHVDPFQLLTALATGLVRLCTQALYHVQGDDAELREQIRKVARRLNQIAECPREELVDQSVAIQESRGAQRH
jgi:hypothetical protein